MKKLVILVSAMIVFACNSKKSGTESPDITGKWKAQTMYSQGKSFNAGNRDSLFNLMMAESKKSELEYDNTYTTEDSLFDANDANTMLDRILGLQYDLQKDGGFVMNVGNPGDSNSLIFKGKYTYDAKTTDLTITLDSAVKNKVTTVKATVKNGLLEMVYDSTARYVMEKAN